MSKTIVIYRYWKGSVIALFPEIVASMDLNMCLSYMHIGQHSAAHIDHIINKSRPATSDEYASLHETLSNSVGYDLEVREKNLAKFYTARKAQINEYYT